MKQLELRLNLLQIRWLPMLRLKLPLMRLLRRLRRLRRGGCDGGGVPHLR